MLSGQMFPCQLKLGLAITLLKIISCTNENEFLHVWTFFSKTEKISGPRKILESSKSVRRYLNVAFDARFFSSNRPLRCLLVDVLNVWFELWSESWAATATSWEYVACCHRKKAMAEMWAAEITKLLSLKSSEGGVVWILRKHGRSRVESWLSARSCSFH